MKLAIALLIALSTPSFCQWRSLKISSGTDVNAIQENFRRASLWSNRKLDRFSNDTLYGQPIFKNGVKFGDGTIQNTAIPSTAAFLQSPATFYVVQTSDYLVSPASFTILSPDQVIPSSATGYYGIRVATATYLATAPGACSAGQFISALTADGTKTCGTPAGSGDAILSATQTWTGSNTFTGAVNLTNSIMTGGGKVRQHSFYPLTALRSVTGVTPFDDTIPQNSEGVEVFVGTITPVNSTSNILVSVQVNAAENANNCDYATLCIFKDSVADAIYCVTKQVVGANYIEPLKMEFMDSPATTNATYYKARLGCDVSTTFTINGIGGGRKLGGKMMSYINLTEVAP